MSDIKPIAEALRDEIARTVKLDLLHHDAAAALDAQAAEIERLRVDAERWRRALSAYERGVLIGYDGRTGERDGYVAEFVAAIRDRAALTPQKEHG